MSGSSIEGFGIFEFDEVGFERIGEAVLDQRVHFFFDDVLNRIIDDGIWGSWALA